MILSAKAVIENEKAAAITELKTSVQAYLLKSLKKY